MRAVPTNVRAHTYFLNASVAQVLAVAQDGDDETLGSRDGNGYIDIIAVDEFFLIDDSVDDWLILERGDGSLDESAHETEFHTMLFNKLFLELFPDVYNVGHVDLIEGRQHRSSVLGFLESLRDSEAHAVHGHSSFQSGTVDTVWRLLRGHHIGVGRRLGWWGGWRLGSRRLGRRRRGCGLGCSSGWFSF